MFHGQTPSQLEDNKRQMEKYLKDMMAGQQREEHERELKQGIGSLLDDAKRIADRGAASLPIMHTGASSISLDSVNLMQGFYTESDREDRSKPHHHVDAEDTHSHHMFQDFPRSHRVLSNNDKQTRRKKKGKEASEDESVNGDEGQGKSTSPDKAPAQDETYPSVFQTPASGTSPTNATSGENIHIYLHSAEPSETSLLAHGHELKPETGQNKDVKFQLGSQILTRTQSSDTDSLGSSHLLEHDDKLSQLPAAGGSAQTTVRRGSHDPPASSDSHKPQRRTSHHKLSAGSDVEFLDKEMDKENVTEKEEADNLNEPDLEVMNSHRTGHKEGRHRKISNWRDMQHYANSPTTAVVHIASTSSDLRQFKKPFDHSPHEMFVELDELYLGNDNEMAWHEKARWIKFEEDVEEGAERWGKAHVSSLSFLSLLELRRCIEQGALLLDLEIVGIIDLVHKITEELVMIDQLSADERHLVRDALLLKHNFMMKKHVTEKGALLNKIGHEMQEVTRRHHRHETEPLMSERLSVAAYAHTPHGRRAASAYHIHHDNEHLGVPGVSPISNDVRRSGSHSGASGGVGGLAPVAEYETDGPDFTSFRKGRGHTNPAMVESHSNNSHIQVDMTSSTPNDHLEKTVTFKESLNEANGDVPHTPGNLPRRGSGSILNKIPKGAEATTVLVGPIKQLSKPVMAFIRLSVGTYLENLTEVDLPVRFVFLLMGPENAGLDYHEIGRSISTLMANPSFHEIAYKAESRVEVLDAINEYLGESIVLPPGRWDRETLLPIMDMQRKRQEAKEKKQQQLKKLQEQKRKKYRLRLCVDTTA